MGKRLEARIKHCTVLHSLHTRMGRGKGGKSKGKSKEKGAGAKGGGGPSARKPAAPPPTDALDLLPRGVWQLIAPLAETLEDLWALTATCKCVGRRTGTWVA